MWTDFWIPFVSVALAELGDKTQLGVMLLASKTQKRVRLFLGVMAGFLLVDGLAIVLGATVTRLVPLHIIKWISGALFILFGVLMLRGDACNGDCEQKAKEVSRPFWVGFLMIAAAEWGDKTQIASGLFAAQFHPLAVLAGTLTALALLSLIAILAGNWISKKIPEALLHRIAAILFILIGLGCFL